MRYAPQFRSAALALLVVSTLGASGCHWFKKGSPYQLAEQDRPLEVPPDLDKPDTASALAGSGSVSRSAMASGAPVAAAGAPAAAAPAAASATSFTVQGEQDATFDQVGQALAATSGASVTNTAKLLGVYEVGYEGSNFMIRVAGGASGVTVSAVDARGAAAAGPAAEKLMGALKAALGGG